MGAEGVEDVNLRAFLFKLTPQSRAPVENLDIHSTLKKFRLYTTQYFIA
jgi:hypothetical protein